jgi:hypothetical protein
MPKFLETQKYPVILLALGGFLILGGFFELKDLVKLQISPYPDPHYFIVSVGLMFSVLSIILYLFLISKILQPDSSGQRILKPNSLKRFVSWR